MTSNTQIAERLREEKRTISAFAYTLRLMLPQSTSAIDDDERRVCAWIDDAVEALLQSPQESASE
jgi:hypothetical protein